MKPGMPKMPLLLKKFKGLRSPQRRSRGFRKKTELRSFTERGQALVEYLLMTVMLLFLFTGLYRVLSGQLKALFAKAGRAILIAYY